MCLLSVASLRYPSIRVPRHPKTVASDHCEHIWSVCSWWCLCRLGRLSYARNLDGGASPGNQCFIRYITSYCLLALLNFVLSVVPSHLLINSLVLMENNGLTNSLRVA